MIDMHTLHRHLICCRESNAGRLQHCMLTCHRRANDWMHTAAGIANYLHVGDRRLATAMTHCLPSLQNIAR